MITPATSSHKTVYTLSQMPNDDVKGKAIYQQKSFLPFLKPDLHAYLHNHTANQNPPPKSQTKLFTRLYSQCSKNCIPKTHLCGLARLKQEEPKKSTEEAESVPKNRSVHIEKLMSFNLPVSRSILEALYKQLDEQSDFLFNQEIIYPALFKCTFGSAEENKFYLEAHKSGKIFLLMFNTKATKISSGSVKRVIKAFELNDPGKIYAYARSKQKVQKNAYNQLENEEEFLGLLNGVKHLVKVYSLHYYGNHQAIVMDYYPEDLFTTLTNIQNQTIFLSAELKIGFCRQLLEFLKEMHQRGIIHRDIKPENLFIKGGCKLKVADFGLSCRDSDQSKLEQAVGTLSYLAPEGWSFNFDSRNKSLDIWSAGCVAWLLLKGETFPWFGLDLKSREDEGNLLEQIYQFHLTLPSRRDYVGILLWHMLNPDPKQRWTAQQCLTYIDKTIIPLMIASPK